MLGVLRIGNDIISRLAEGTTSLSSELKFISVCVEEENKNALEILFEYLIEQQQNLPSLVRFDLIRCYFTPKAMKLLCKVIKVNTTIRTFSLESCRWYKGPSICRALLKNRRIRKVILFELDFRAEYSDLCTLLKKSDKIISLKVSNWQLSHNYWTALCSNLKKCSTLTSLEIDQDIDFDRSLLMNALLENTSLTRLELKGRMTGLSLKDLAQALESPKNNIRELSVLWFDIPPDGVIAIGQALKTNTKLTKLALEISFSTPDAHTIFAEGLKGNTTLKTLHLTQDNIDSELIEALKSNQSITEFSYEGKDIQLACQSVTPSVKKFSTGSIGPQSTDIIKGSSDSIVELIKTNRSVTTLELFGIILRESINFDHLSESLRLNNTITELSLTQQVLDQRNLEKILHVLKESRILTKLDLSYNDWSKDSCNTIGELLTANKSVRQFILKGAHDHASLKLVFSKICEALETNETLTHLTYRTLITAHSDIITKLKHYNYTLLCFENSMTIDASIEEWLTRNRMHQQYMTILSMNIARNYLQTRLPIEIWHRIFTHLKCTQLNIKN